MCAHLPPAAADVSKHRQAGEGPPPGAARSRTLPTAAPFVPVSAAVPTVPPAMEGVG
ncbi:MAG TPA: hypothetical protein VKU91_07055 [Acidimicrobiales bacterium]|nr:hypothetical protein [Acidimicrobiales bacterium]